MEEEKKQEKLKKCEMEEKNFVFVALVLKMHGSLEILWLRSRKKKHFQLHWISD